MNNLPSPSPVTPGGAVVYVGRIPHGFFELEMKAYFSQFGDITRIRLSRNRKTGSSKHYAFIEFRLASVAKIAAETMHNYLLFGHLLQVKVIPDNQVHPDTFKGANKKFRPVPWREVNRDRMEALPKTKIQLERAAERRAKKLAIRQDKAKALGIEI